MKKITTVLLLAALATASCSTPFHNLFGKKTPHEAYEEKLDDRDLDKTPEGRMWLAASQKALQTPQAVALPYRLQGYFHADKPRALGLKFEAKQGERITFTLTRKPGQNLPLYADLYIQKGGAPSHLVAVDTSGAQFTLDIDETGFYLLRLQPELYRSGEYSLSVSIGPSLTFPVSGNKARIGSFWGADRDGGKRRHEGVDIFAPRLTPAVAGTDGYIVGVREGGIGGKTVWLKPKDKNVNLYYAHLDKQLVKEGQFVHKGDVVGLVGNTGNAKHTASHLHFGVYTYEGAVDPLPFVDQQVKTAPAVPDKKLTDYVKLTQSQKTPDGSTVKSNTLAVPLAATGESYIVETPDGQLLQVPFSAAKPASQAVGKGAAVAAKNDKVGSRS